MQRVTAPFRRLVNLLHYVLAWLFTLGLVALVVIGVVLFAWGAITYWWRTDGPDGPHWGQNFICTEYKSVYLDRFNGTEEECVAGYWEEP